MEMKVSKAEIPIGSLVAKCLPADYCDAYSIELPIQKNISADDVLVAFWTMQPVWLNWLFRLRNTLVRPFGLKGENPELDAGRVERAIRSGSAAGVMTVYAKSPVETVLCLSDKHLMCYISALVENMGGNRRIVLVTVVNFHYWLGKVYFSAIRPFHGLVVKFMLRYIIRKIG